MKKPNIVFFGTPLFATNILDTLKEASILPSLIVSAPDAPKGRKLILTPPPVKVWGEEEGIPVLQPENLKDDSLAPLVNSDWDLFIVAAYGNILSSDILALPRFGTLNVHPSLLPKFRGASPVQQTILENARTTGVSIMLLDEKMDHGPILTQARIEIEKEDWPMRATTLEALLAHAGGELLAEIIDPWITGKITPEPQDHTKATFTQKITKEMGEINLNDDPYTNLLKINAYDVWPGTFFFCEKNGKKIRVKITDAKLNDDGSLHILKVIPEGKKEMDYESFLRD